MTDTTAVATAVGMLNAALSAFKNVRDLSSDSTDLNLKEGVAELHDKLIDLKQSLMDLTDENRSLKQKLEARAELETDKVWEPDGNFYRRRSDVADGRDIPYCPVCWETTSRAVPMHPRGIGTYGCALHKTAYSNSKHDEHMRKLNTEQRREHAPYSWMAR